VDATSESGAPVTEEDSSANLDADDPDIVNESESSDEEDDEEDQKSDE
jgi:hypothetical protein